MICALQPHRHDAKLGLNKFAHGGSFACLQNDTAAAFFKGEVKGFWQLAVSGVWDVFS